MVNFFKGLGCLALAGAAMAKNVACVVNGVQQSIVDLDTGFCAFEIPPALPAVWEFTSPQDYSAQFYYTIVDNVRIFTDIIHAGRTITVAAIELYGKDAVAFFEIISEASSPTNSSGALRKRFSKYGSLDKRDEETDFANSLKKLDGVAVPGASFLVTDPISSSVAPTGPAATGTQTVTVASTTLVTITSCSDNLCSKTAVPATLGETTVTKGEEVTSYTTWCPLSGSELTTIVTITSCSNNMCEASAAPATLGYTTVTNNNEVTSYVTWCPVTATQGAAAAATTPATVAAESTAPAQNTVAAISTSVLPGSANAVRGSALAVLLVPLLALF